ETIAEDRGLLDDLDGHAVPALIVWGELDRVLDVSGAPLLQARLPRSTLIVREGVGHLPMIEEPARSARDFIAFADGLVS
ncbi:MAG: alpha/beta hydrolase, partial [Pseudomonadota bacterium]